MDAMLDSMTSRQVSEWHAYYQLKAEREAEAESEAKVRQRAEAGLK